MRGLRFLILLLIAIPLGWYAYRDSKKGAVDDTPKKDKVFTVDADKIDELEIKSESGDRTTLKRKGTDWTIVQPISAPADQSTISGITSNLSSLEIQRVLDENPGDLKEFGLASPRIEVAYTSARQQRRLQIGDKTPTGSDLYAKLSDGKRVFLAGLKSPLLSIADPASHKVTATVGPFANVIRPFTVNGSNTLVFVNINGLLGFEVGDIRTGKKLYRVEVEGYKQGTVKRHGCPSHGIALTPDEKELWVADCANEAIHIFDSTVMPPKQMKSIKARDCVGWVNFSIDGKTAYSSTGEMIDVASKKIVAALQDEAGHQVQSEKQLELVVSNGKVIRAGDQFGIGAVTRQ